MEAKAWYTSKVIWFNVLTVLLAIVGFLMVTQSTSGLPFDLDPKWLIVVSGIGNILLRFVTTAPIGGNQ